MAKARSLVGLDVHATKIVVAVLDGDTGELEVFVMDGENANAAALCAGLARPVRVAYEAGPTGYVLARELAKRGVECVVAAPSKIPRASGDKVKNDRRDAEHLVRLLLAGKLHPVRVPGPEEEALRDLVRARETLRLDLMRGVDTLTAVGLCAEIGDFERFARAGQLISYLGLVPSESTTGQHRRLGSITKTGSAHARRLLVEAAWHYRRAPSIRKTLTERQAGQPAEAVAVAWTAQRRLHRTWTRLEARSKRRTIIAVATARELVGFCWAITQIE
jgi:transposase